MSKKSREKKRRKMQQRGLSGYARPTAAAQDESPEIVQAVERLKAQPGFMEELQKDADEGFQEFEEQILNGEVKLDLFAPEELQRPLRAMAEYLATNQIDAVTADQQEMAKRLAEFVRRAIGEVMTKDRTKKMRVDLTRISSQWLRERDWRGALLHEEISWLDSVKPVDNPFVYQVFASEMKGWRDAQVESGTARAASAGPASRPESESPKVAGASNRPGAWASESPAFLADERSNDAAIIETFNWTIAPLA